MPSQQTTKDAEGPQGGSDAGRVGLAELPRFRKIVPTHVHLLGHFREEGGNQKEEHSGSCEEGQPERQVIHGLMNRFQGGDSDPTGSTMIFEKRTYGTMDYQHTRK